MFARAALVVTMLLASIASAAACQCRLIPLENSERIVVGKVISGGLGSAEERSKLKQGYNGLYKFTMTIDGTIKGDAVGNQIIVFTDDSRAGCGSAGFLEYALKGGLRVEVALSTYDGHLITSACHHHREAK